MRLFERIRFWFICICGRINTWRLRRTKTLSIKGVYFRNYCRDVVAGTEQYIEEYEEMLFDFSRCLKCTDGKPVSRIDAAKFFCKLTDNMN